MIRPALVLRPAPANERTVARLRAAGVDATGLPLFRTEPRDWHVPAPDEADALLLTSANALRHAGAGLSALAGLPVVAVGQATAAAARDAGLSVALIGTTGAAAVAAQAAPRFPRLLHLTGADHVAVPGALTRIVYASVPVEVPPACVDAALDSVVLLHSARAARRFATLFGDRARTRVRVAALSAAVSDAAGGGWAACAVATRPDDAALVERAVMLAIDP